MKDVRETIDTIREVVGVAMMVVSGILVIFVYPPLFHNDTFMNQFFLTFWTMCLGFAGYFIQEGPRKRRSPRRKAELARCIEYWQRDEECPDASAGTP